MIAIVVPFRPQKEQNREAQLPKFLEHMSSFLRGDPPSGVVRPSFVVVVVTQSDDGRKFNRGQCLNIGVDEARRLVSPAPLASIVLHDVDLLPAPGLLPWYCSPPPPGRPTNVSTPASNEKYAGLGGGYLFFGGVTALNGADFEVWADFQLANDVPTTGGHLN